MSFQLQASATASSKPLHLVNLSIFYTARTVSEGLPGDENSKQELITSEYNAEKRYDVIRTSGAELKLNLYPDGQPILEAATLPAISALSSEGNAPQISVKPSLQAFINSRGESASRRSALVLQDASRQMNVETLQTIKIPVFLPPLQVGTHFYDPQQLSMSYSDEDVYKLQTQARFLVGPGNPSCVDCNLRLFPFNLMSGFGPIATVEGEKPYLFPQISTEKPIYAPTHGIVPNAKRSDVCDGVEKLIQDEFDVRTVPGPPPIPWHTIVYAEDTGGCTTPRALGFSSGNLVERGMIVTDTISVLKYAVSASPVITPLRFPIRNPRRPQIPVT